MPESSSSSSGLADGPIVANPDQSARLTSLDALRGFDMFWIIGGAGFARAVGYAISKDAGDTVTKLTEHPTWNGYTPWDQIFPMFMFVAGAAIPFSLAKHGGIGDSKMVTHWRILRRGLLLVLLGMIVNGLLLLDFANQRYPSVLGRIGLGYMFAALIALHTGVRGRILWTIGLLVGYWAALKYIPVPEFGAGDWNPGHTLGDYLDRSLLPGRLHRGDRDPEGLFSTIPSIATVLTGVLAGDWLRSIQCCGKVKAARLFVAGLACVVAGQLWDPWFPLNKNLWTSSFVLFTSGWSAMLLALFYLMIDVWGFHKWAFPFVVIGMNAITIYLLDSFIDFAGVSEIVFARAKNSVHPALFAGGEVLLAWLLVFGLYRSKIFFKV